MGVYDKDRRCGRLQENVPAARNHATALGYDLDIYIYNTPANPTLATIYRMGMAEVLIWRNRQQHHHPHVGYDTWEDMQISKVPSRYLLSLNLL